MGTWIVELYKKVRHAPSAVDLRRKLSFLSPFSTLDDTPLFVEGTPNTSTRWYQFISPPTAWGVCSCSRTEVGYPRKGTRQTACSKRNDVWVRGLCVNWFLFVKRQVAKPKKLMIMFGPNIYIEK